MTKKMIAAAITGAALSMAASAAAAGTLTDATVTLSSNGLSQPTAITATYTIVAPLDPDEFILVLQLPADFTSIISFVQPNCTGVTLTINNVVQTFGASDPCAVFTHGSVYVRTPVPVGNGDMVAVHLASTLFRTPPTPGVKTFTQFHTADIGSTPVDSASPLPSVTIAAPAPAPVPTMTEWAMILMTVALGGFAALTIQKRRRTV